MDRFHGVGDEKMPFYDILLDQVRRYCQFPLRSWLGERAVSSDSATRKELQSLEMADDINRPDDVTCALDRQEENWLTVAEIGYVAQVFFATAIDLDVKQYNRRLIEVSRGLNTWRKSGNAMSAFREQEPIDRTLNVMKAIKDIQQAYETGYMAAEKAEIRSISLTREHLSKAEMRGDLLPPDATPILVKTTGRAILAMNESNPFELLDKTSKALLAMYHSRNWVLREDGQREALNEACHKLFGYTLDTLSKEYQRLGDL